MNGMYPQVDSQVIYLHILCGVMAIFLSGRLITNKCNTEVFNHPLIYLPFLLALNGIVSASWEEILTFHCQELLK